MRKLFRVLVKAEAYQSGIRFKCAVLVAAQDLKICRFCDGLFVSQEKVYANWFKREFS